MEKLICEDTPIVREDYTVLYERLFPAVARWVGQRGGSFDDARDIFQDALVIYIEKCEHPSFRLSVSAEAYVHGIARHLWIRKFKSGLKFSSLETTESSRIPEDYFPSVNTTRLLQWLEHTGSKCLDLLLRFYSADTSLREIASSLGFRNEHSASVQKYKCIEKIRETIKQKSAVYEDFLN